MLYHKRNYMNTTTDISIEGDLKAILGDVHEVTRVTPDQVMSRRRISEWAQARQMTYYLLRSMGYGYAEIGRVMDRDHSGIIYGCNSVKDFAKIEKKTKMRMEAFRRKGYDV